MIKTILNKKSIYMVKYGLYRMMDVAKTINLIIANRELDELKSKLNSNMNSSLASSATINPYYGGLSNTYISGGLTNDAINAVINQLGLGAIKVRDVSVSSADSMYGGQTLDFRADIC